MEAVVYEDVFFDAVEFTDLKERSILDFFRSLRAGVRA